MRCPAPITPTFSARRSSLLTLLTPRGSFSEEVHAYDKEAQTRSRPSWTRSDPRRRLLTTTTTILALLTTLYFGLSLLASHGPIPFLPSLAEFDRVFYPHSTPNDPHVSHDDLHGTTSYNRDPNHVLVARDSHRPQPLLQSIRRPPYSVVSEYYLSGNVPNDSPPVRSPPMDVVYLWVNASGPFFTGELHRRSQREGLQVEGGDGKRYRDNGELRGAIRSAVASLSGIGRIHVISGDYPFSNGKNEHLIPGDTPAEQEQYHMGQIPEWLDWDAVLNGTAGLAWHFHSSIFYLPRDEEFGEGLKALEEKEKQWRAQSTPSFNSFAIESRVSWIDGLSEHYLLANDDMFMLSPMSQADFHHPLLGDVVRRDSGLLVKPEITPDLYSTPGEWGGLQYAAQLLSQRFPSASRGYLNHLPKIMSRASSDEASVIWEDELTDAATRGFRRSKRGLADIEMSWLTTYLRIERWREALLWTYIVAKIGGEQGVWDEAARTRFMDVLKIEDDSEDEVLVTRGQRGTLSAYQLVSDKVDIVAPKKTNYYYSSMDGFLPPRPERSHEYAKCNFTLSTCLPRNFLAKPTMAVPAEDIFTRMAFEHPECGDCLITALVTASGPYGLRAFLPDEDQIFVPERRERSRWERDEPILSLTKTWQTANFSMAHVVRPGQDEWDGASPAGYGRVSLRQWCIKLLSRYPYVIGTTHTRFSQVHSLAQLDAAVSGYDANRDLAMACVNDDQPDDAPDTIRERFLSWMQGRWGSMDVPWERRGFGW